MLKTPLKIRELQRKLYQKAKQEKGYMYESAGLYKIPTTAPWMNTAKTYGRR